MKKRAVNVLVVEDDLVDYKAVQRALSSYSDPMFLLERAASVERGKRMLEEKDFDAVILDLGLPDMTGMDSVLHFQANAPDTPIVVLTGQPDARMASGAVGMGAEDFLLKSDLAPKRLEEKLRLAMERHRAKLHVLESVDALERTVSHLSERAHTDALTGLANRLGLEQHLALLRSQGAHPVPVAMVDLDNFKQINDVYGHAVGDKVLAELGRRVQVTAGREAFVARVGGDEFVAILNNLSRPQAEAMAQCLRLAVCAELFSVGADIKALALTATVVLSEHSAVDLGLEPILSAAHLPLSHGKAHGKNQVLCAWVMDELASLENALGGLDQPMEGFDTLGAPVVLLESMTVIAYRLRFAALPHGGFVEDRQLDLARLDHDLSGLTLACIRKAIAWGDGPPFQAIHIDLEIDVLDRRFAEQLLRTVPSSIDRERLCFFLPAQFSEMQGERASKVVRTLRQSGFSFGIRGVGAGATAIENLLLLQPAWIRLSHQLSSGVAQMKVKRDRLQQWVSLLNALKIPLLADQVSDKDLDALAGAGLLGAVRAGLSRDAY